MKLSLKNLAKIIVSAAVIVAWLAACSLDEVSREERLSRFQSDLNNNRARVEQNLHPELGSAYNDAAFWDLQFAPTATYSFSITGRTGSTLVTLVSSSPGGALRDGQTLNFEMKEDGKNNWMIRRICNGGCFVQ